MLILFPPNASDAWSNGGIGTGVSNFIGGDWLSENDLDKSRYSQTFVSTNLLYQHKNSLKRENSLKRI